METVRKNWDEIWKVRNTVTDIMNASDRTIRPDKAKERIDEIEDRSIEITQTKQRKTEFKKNKKQ